MDCEVSLSADSKIENIDRPGGVTIEMDVPASVKAGGSLLTKVSFTGVSEEKPARPSGIRTASRWRRTATAGSR